MTQFLFDVDGTLTNPREPVNPDFAKYFGEWVNSSQKKGNQVFLAGQINKRR